MKPYHDGKYWWHPYDITYVTPDGKFSTIIWAISEYHAAIVLTDLRESARVDGKIIGEVKL